MFKKKREKIFALVQETQTALTEALHNIQTEFAEVKQIADAGERYIALSTLETKCCALKHDTDNHTNENLKQHKIGRRPAGSTLFVTGMTGTFATYATIGFFTPPVAIAIIIGCLSVGIAGALLGDGRKPQEKIYQQCTTAFYQKIDDILHEIKGQRHEIRMNHRDDLAHSKKFQYLFNNFPDIKADFLDAMTADDIIRPVVKLDKPARKGAPHA